MAKLTQEILRKMIKEEITNALQVNEDHNDSLANYDYVEKSHVIDKVVITLKKNGQNSDMQETAGKFIELNDTVKKLTKELEPLKKELKDTVIGLCEATDACYTRVIKTGAFLIQVAKDSETESYDMDVIKKGISELQPKLRKQMEALLESARELKPRIGNLTVKSESVNKLTEGLIDKVKSFLTSLKNKVLSALKIYDVDFNAMVKKAKK